jgi:hypothetical protein
MKGQLSRREFRRHPASRLALSLGSFRIGAAAASDAVDSSAPPAARRAGLRRLAGYLHREVALGSHHSLQSHARELPVGMLVGRLREGRLVWREEQAAAYDDKGRRRARLLSARLSKGRLLLELDDRHSGFAPARRRSARQR